MNIYLCGLPGSGKSYWGAILAKELHLPFFDTDQLLEQKYGKSCRELFQEGNFREKECAILQGLQGVIALGGGTLVHEDSLHYVLKQGKLLYIKEDLETIRERLGDRKPANQTFESLLARLSTFEKYATYTFTPNRKPHGQ